MAELMKRRRIRKSELLEIYERQYRKYYKDWISDEVQNHFAGLLTVATKAQLEDWLKKWGYCEYSGEPIQKQDIEFDHSIPNAMLYQGDEIQWQVILKKWHKVKTAKDVKDIAKAKRLAGETGQHARRKRRGISLIQNRGFQKAPDGYQHFGARKSNTRIDG